LRPEPQSLLQRHKGLWASLCSSPQLCAEDVKDLLEHMAIVRINKGWEFILPHDREFIKKHPDVVQRQHMLWTGIQAK
jgi:DNA-directed RNA polymerase-3 subunit RPC5